MIKNILIRYLLNLHDFIIDSFLSMILKYNDDIEYVKKNAGLATFHGWFDRNLNCDRNIDKLRLKFCKAQVQLKLS